MPVTPEFCPAHSDTHRSECQQIIHASVWPKAAIGLIPAVAGFILITIIGIRIRRALRRKRLMTMPFPLAWQNILEHNVPIYRHLPPSLRAKLNSDIHIFLTEKKFEGCGGLNINDEIKVTIAGQACMLLLNRKSRCYPKLTSILVYPGAYVRKKITPFGGQYLEEQAVHAGESWPGGAVVLAWDHVKRGLMDIHDGHNIVLHEFAHQLDQEDGRANGAPILEQRSRYVTWARILSREYERLQHGGLCHQQSVMDDYGATNPAEFFAVATETFFEKPKQLKKKTPDLYDELKEYYQVDPAEWLA